jgi:hypothetical protein
MRNDRRATLVSGYARLVGWELLKKLNELSAEKMRTETPIVRVDIYSQPSRSCGLTFSKAFDQPGGNVDHAVTLDHTAWSNMLLHALLVLGIETDLEVDLAEVETDFEG